MLSKKNIFLFLLISVLLFTFIFNFSSAFTGTDRQALIDSLIKEILIIKEKILAIQQQLIVLITNQAQNKKINSELNIVTDGAKTTEDYYKKFSDIAVKINFTQDELNTIKKDKDGRAMLLEELFDEVSQLGITDELKISFIAWHQLDENIVSELKKMPISESIVSLNQWMIGWYQYHSDLAQKFTTETLTNEQINPLIKEFKNKADIHNNDFKNSLVGLNKSRDFVLIPTAQAFTCAAFTGPFYHFGGKVTVMYPCNFGIVETISPPCGGMLLFTYAVLAANPYLWKKPTTGSSVLGRSIVAPGLCPLGICPGCTFFPYEAIVLFFGSSQLP